MESRGMVLEVEAEVLPFSEAAQKAIDAAYEESRRYRDEYVSTEHLLLGLLRTEDGALCHLLNGRQISLEDARSVVVRSRTGGYMPEAELSMTPRARRVLTLAREEAQRLQSDSIGREHLLLGLLREDEGLAAVILKKQGLRLEELRLQVRASACTNV